MNPADIMHFIQQRMQNSGSQFQPQGQQMPQGFGVPQGQRPTTFAPPPGRNVANYPGTYNFFGQQMPVGPHMVRGMQPQPNRQPAGPFLTALGR